MNYNFQSCYQDAMNGHLEFRKALGFSAKASLTYLHRFGRCCVDNLFFVTEHACLWLGFHGFYKMLIKTFPMEWTVASLTDRERFTDARLFSLLS